jgi:hypothetical protein
MRRLCVLLCALILAPGCASEGDKAQWEEVWKDLRGENMEMGRRMPEFKEIEKPAPRSKSWE